VPHGGPHSAHADGWALPTSFLAACGYCVLLVNFRGSTVREPFFFSFLFFSSFSFRVCARKKKAPHSFSLSFSFPIEI
jgi:hypothetical protein